MAIKTSSRKRCDWANANPLMAEYHDKEWGVPVRNDKKQFEFLVLESAQAGLSWMTILKKREHYRRAFADFDPTKVARFTRRHVERLLENDGIIRNRLKIEATINNAARFLEIQEEFGGFSDYIWSFVGGKPIRNSWAKQTDLPATSTVSVALAKELKQRGFKFLGSTVLYAHMQATGMVNDHLESCFRHAACNRRR